VEIGPAPLPAPESSTGPKTGRGQRTRAALLQAAREEFEEEGYGATGVLGITRRAGVSNATFYFYFPGKEAIFLALIEEVVGGIVANSRPAMVQEHLAQRMPLADALGRANHRYLDLYIENARFLQVLDEASSLSADVRAVMRERWEREMQVSTDLLVQGQQAGLVDPDIDARSVSTVLSAMVRQTAQLLAFGEVQAEREVLEEALSLATVRVLRIRRRPRKRSVTSVAPAEAASGGATSDSPLKQAEESGR
jgi:AcrR family transcriptional regulator